MSIIAEFILCAVALGIIDLWRSAFSPKGDEPRGLLDRSLRLIGAYFLTIAVLYGIGTSLGIIPPYSK
jgi:hypothetical protein